MGVTAKHFVANDQEFDRHDLSSNVDERTLRELDLKPFEICVKNGVASVMTSYNPLNGVHTSQDAWLINTILKGEWGFNGIVMSDWDSCYDTEGMANGGLDLEPRDAARKILHQGKAHAAHHKRQDHPGHHRRQSAPHLPRGIPVWLAGLSDDRYQHCRDDGTADVTALESARECITLLLNKDNVLPLNPDKVHHIAVLGSNANPAIVGGGGSSYTEPFRPVSVFAALRNFLGANAVVTRVPAVPPADTAQGATPGLPADYVDKVKTADFAVVCVGFNGKDDKGNDWPDSYEGEGSDRTYALPPGQEELIKAVTALNPKTIVVLNAGGSVATAGWIDKVPALIDAYYPGQYGGNAITEVIFGRGNPAGRLAFSWDKRWEDCAAYGNYPTSKTPAANTYKEGVFAGYRWFDSRKDIEPLFPFGYGLSYTTYDFSGLKVSAPDDKGNITATATIKNTGARAGDEVVQLYVQPPEAPVPRPYAS